MHFRIAFAIAAALAAFAFVSALPQGQAPVAASNWSWPEKDRKYEYALVSADGSTHSWGSWSTDELKKLGGLSGDRLIVKKKDGSLYAITDKGIVDGAKKGMEPVRELGRQQGALGRKQGELGREQGKLGQKMGELGREMGKASKEWAQSMRDSHREENRAGAQKKREEYDRKMADLQKRMQALSDEQKAFGGKQGELGKQQGELGRRQGEASKRADETITKLIDQAFEKGLAKAL